MEAGIATDSDQRSRLILDLWRRLHLSATVNRLTEVGSLNCPPPLIDF
jgi:hypothetical protein